MICSNCIRYDTKSADGAGHLNEQHLRRNTHHPSWHLLGVTARCRAPWPRLPRQFGTLRSEGRGRRGQRESAVRLRNRGGRAVRPRSGCAAEDVVVAPVRERVVEHRRPDSEISQADEKPGVSEVEYDERSGREPGEVAECPRDQADADELREPQPGLAQLATLVDSVRSTGLPVTLQVDGEPPADSAAVGPSVYRIVQESLTNVLKHAGDARVSVRVSCGATAVDVVVEDDGPGRSANGAAPPGYGLAGMRERAALFGGTFTAGNRGGGGFEVRAHLPIPQPL